MGRLERGHIVENVDRRSSERTDRSHFERCILSQRRKYARQPPRQHRLSRTRRAAHQQMMPAGSRHDQSLNRLLLTDDVGEIEDLWPCLLRDGGRYRLDVGYHDVGAVPHRHLGQCRCSAHLNPRHEPRLRRVRVRDDHPLESRPCRCKHCGQHAGHRAHPPIEPQLTDVHSPGKGRSVQHTPVATAEIAIPRSKPLPCLGRLAGERFTVSRSLVNSSCAFVTALCTR